MDHASLTEYIVAEIDGDDDAGAERAADRHRDWIDQCAVDQPAAVDLHRTEDARQRERRLERIHPAAFVKPDLMPGAELGRDRDEPSVQFLDLESFEVMLQPCAQALPGNEARAREIDVEKAEDAAPSQGAGEILERVKPLCDEAGAGHGTNRRAGDDVALE